MQPWSTFGPHSIGTEPFATVSSGASSAQVATAILQKQARAQNPDKDAVTRGWKYRAVPIRSLRFQVLGSDRLGLIFDSHHSRVHVGVLLGPDAR